MGYFVFWATVSYLVFCSAAKVEPKVRCSPQKMRVEVPITEKTKMVYLEGLRDFPDLGCRPHTDSTGKMAVLELDLSDVYRCAVTRVLNQKTGKQIYYQTVVIESEEDTIDGSIPKKLRETLHVKCSILSIKNHTLSRRSVLPAGFQEPEDLEITKTVTEMAPEPNLGVGVRQAGKLVTGELNVSPGTPLQMEIFLDKNSAPIYGILVSHMQVTDTKQQEETIIYNGCSVDPYLFENFNTVDGDFLTAKFRVFKFPESTYVQFRGTVSVCLDKCQGIECSDGKIGYGRRRKRAISSLPPDPNKIFEITITSYIKVKYDEESENFEGMIRNHTRLNKLETENGIREKQLIYETVEKREEKPRMQKEEEKLILVIEGSTNGATCVSLNLFAFLLLFIGNLNV